MRRRRRNGSAQTLMRINPKSHTTMYNRFSLFIFHHLHYSFSFNSLNHKSLVNCNWVRFRFFFQVKEMKWQLTQRTYELFCILLFNHLQNFLWSTVKPLHLLVWNITAVFMEYIDKYTFFTDFSQTSIALLMNVSKLLSWECTK